jgi:glutathione S-transferase
MYKLYHHPLCPFSRKIRIFLAAKEIEFELVAENVWERRKEFLAINPANTTPVLFDEENDFFVCNSSVIIEYIEEKHGQNNSFIGNSLASKAESRRIQSWFDEKFYQEVSKHILTEKYFNRFTPVAHQPNSEILRIARHNLNTHLSYIEYLIENQKYLASDDQITIADFAALGHISALDYFGDINWHHHEEIKNWYSLIKSHKFFNQILKDRVTNIFPPEYYSKLDF